MRVPNSRDQDGKARYQIAGQGDLVGVKRRIPIIVQNLPVPVDRQVWLERHSLPGSGWSAPGAPLATRLESLDVSKTPTALVSRGAIPWLA